MGKQGVLIKENRSMDLTGKGLEIPNVTLNVRCDIQEVLVPEKNPLAKHRQEHIGYLLVSEDLIQDLPETP